MNGFDHMRSDYGSPVSTLRGVDDTKELRMTTLTPPDAIVAPLRYKLENLNTDVVSESWFESAVDVLRGGGSGEHGLLLYKLVRCLEPVSPSVILDVGTARGFSAITMARALLDANLDGMVYSVDVIDHHSRLNWHRGKQDPTDPLANIIISRSEIWSRWFDEEARWVTPAVGQSHEILENWSNGPIALAFIDGDHTYDAVIRDLSLLEHLMDPAGVIVLDDYHTGVSMGTLRSRPVNGVARLIGRATKNVWPSMYERLRLGAGNEFMVVKRRHAGVYRAVYEFLMERRTEWALEIVHMPQRRSYHEADYSLALLSRRSNVSA